jgi:hypothetical protein
MKNQNMSERRGGHSLEAGLGKFHICSRLPSRNILYFFGFVIRALGYGDDSKRVNELFDRGRNSAVMSESVFIYCRIFGQCVKTGCYNPQ